MDVNPMAADRLEIEMRLVRRILFGCPAHIEPRRYLFAEGERRPRLRLLFLRHLLLRLLLFPFRARPTFAMLLSISFSISWLRSAIRFNSNINSIRKQPKQRPRVWRSHISNRLVSDYQLVINVWLPSRTREHDSICLASCLISMWSIGSCLAFSDAPIHTINHVSISLDHAELTSTGNDCKSAESCRNPSRRASATTLLVSLSLSLDYRWIIAGLSLVVSVTCQSQFNRIDW